MVTHLQMNEAYYETFFDLDSAFTELIDYTTSSDNVIFRTIAHFGANSSMWSQHRDDMTIQEQVVEVNVPKKDYEDYIGVPAPKIGDKITILNPDTLIAETVLRVSDIANSNRAITFLTCMVDNTVKRGRGH